MSLSKESIQEFKEIYEVKKNTGLNISCFSIRLGCSNRN